MKEVYLFDAVRTPRGKGSAKNGSLRNIKPIHLLSQLFQALEDRNELDTQAIEGLILGCVGQFGDQGANIAKIASVYHGWPNHVDGATVNTFCTSALTAIGMAMGKIRSGMSDLVVAGGVEMLSRVPMFADKGAWFSDDQVVENSHFTHMGVAADLIASLEGFTQQELDAYAVQSHQRAALATENGHFQRSLIPVKDQTGYTVLDHDECIRPASTVQSMAALKPLFGRYVTPSIRQKMHQLYPALGQLKHFHHVGNSPAMADGACLLLLGNLEKGKALGLTPRAKILAYDNTACEPIIMLLGGQMAMEKAVKKAGLTMSNMDLHNFAEAFSATCLKYQRDLNIAPDKFNVNGCTMTMGHAQGASGAMITTTLLDELERQDLQFGVAGISGGAGLGAGIVIERV
ncbi:MAG: acetyl-CoA C-acyltransferase [Bacteroidota bacterium]